MVTKKPARKPMGREEFEANMRRIAVAIDKHRPSVDTLKDMLVTLVQSAHQYERIDSKRRIASGRNLAAREWVREQFTKRGDPAETRAAFAERIRVEVPKRFAKKSGEPLAPDFKTVYQDWLKGL